MPLRAAMPASVMKPIIEATDSGCPATLSAITLPISASGNVAHDDEGQNRRADSADRAR